MGLAHDPIIFGLILRLVSHKEYAVNMFNSIIKDMDLDECGEHAIKDLGASSLFNLAKVSICQVYFFFYISFPPPPIIIIILLLAMVRMKAFQDRCEAKEGVVRRQRKRLEYKAKELYQYKKASCILNVELTTKIALLEQETCCREKLAKANTNLTTEFVALCEQME